MMGSGKSSVGRTIAEKTGRRFVDTDLLVQKRIARPIRQFFDIYGQDAFRDFETAMLRSLEPSEAVLATGGGIVLRPENWLELRRLGPIFYLRARPETLASRLEVTRVRRPLLAGDDWKQKLTDIFELRAEIYEQADYCVDVDDLDLERVAESIIAIGEALDATD